MAVDGVRRVARALMPAPLRRWALPRFIAASSPVEGLQVRTSGDVIDVCSGQRTVRIGSRHVDYLPDVLASFDYYFSAVHPIVWPGGELVDYSTPRYHDVVGFDDFPVHFPSFSEPIVTTTQYLDFAGLQRGMTVLDLGAYAGLTSMLFARAVSPGGQVVAVDADAGNLLSLRLNLARWRRAGGLPVEIVHGAVWNHDRGLAFSTEGNMGSSAVDIVGDRRGTVAQVPSFTLAGLVDRCQLRRVDFVKCDIEGAEAVALDDAAFFAHHRPRIIIETHVVDGTETTAGCVATLSRHGYRCERLTQHGVSLPLLACTPQPT